MTAGLVIEDLTVRYPLSGGRALTAVDAVSLTLAPGEILGIVGESGCGKSTLARAIAGLQRAASGRVLLDGVEPARVSGASGRALRRRIQLVFQDPESALSPRLTIGQTLEEPLRIAGVRDRRVRAARVRELLELVRLSEAVAQRRPQALSGGQRQRVGIARALASGPDILVCDEPVSALDVSLRAQVMNVLLDLRTELGVSCLLIAHDLGVVRQACDRIGVMYMGRVVETGPAAAVCDHPEHPYSRALLAAVPSLDPDDDARRARTLTGEVPSPLERPSGCRFRTRCPVAEPRCADLEPRLGPGERAAACHLSTPATA